MGGRGALDIGPDIRIPISGICKQNGKGRSGRKDKNRDLSGSARDRTGDLLWTTRAGALVRQKS